MKKLPFEFEDLGEQSVKNIPSARPRLPAAPGRASFKIAIEPSCDAVTR